MTDTSPVNCGSRLSIDQAEALLEKLEAAVQAGRGCCS